jgi:hypothetical protein
VIEAKDTGKYEIEIWGDGNQTRSFCYIDDCTYGIDQIMHCDDLIATPINLGSSELVSINDLVSIIEEIGGVKLDRRYDLDAPKGVAGRNSDNTMIKSILNWEPNTPCGWAWRRHMPGSSSSTTTAKPEKEPSASDIHRVIGSIPLPHGAGRWLDRPALCLSTTLSRPDRWWLSRSNRSFG